MTQEQIDNNARLWSEMFHTVITNILAPKGFKVIELRDNTQKKISDLNYLTDERIRKAAVMAMRVFRQYYIAVDSVIGVKLSEQIQRNLDVIDKQKAFKKRWFNSTSSCFELGLVMGAENGRAELLEEIYKLITEIKPTEPNYGYEDLSKHI